MNPWRLILYPIVAVIVISIALVAVTFVYMAQVARESERNTHEQIRVSEQKWCSIVTLFNDTYKQTPPQSPQGRQIAERMIALESAFGCPRAER